MILVLGRGKLSWVSRDCGRSFYVINHGTKAYRFLFHPVFESYVLGLFKSEGCEGTACSDYGSLAVSKDWGKTWQTIRQRVIDFSWYSL